MKKVFSIFIFIALCNLSCFAQSNFSDSLMTVLKTTTKPIERFDILNKLDLERNTQGGIVDSSITMQMLQIAQELNNDSLLAISYNWLGTYFYVNDGDNTTALEYYYKGIPYAEKVKDKRRISSLYFDMALVYFDLQENEQALQATQLGKENLPDTSNALYNFMLVQYQANMAQYLLITNQADSAYFYAKEMERTYKMLGENASYQFTTFTFLAAAYAQKGMPEMADTYFSKALALVDPTKRPVDWLAFYNNYIPFLLAEKRYKEAKMQADNLFAYGIRLKNNGLKLAGAGYLRQFFDAMNQVDSAYYYSEMEAKINNLIFSASNKNKIQNLAFKERMRSFEDAKRKEDYQNRLVKYGLLAGLAVFLLVAFVLLRNNKQKQKTNKVLQQTLIDLKSTQSQLIQSEKMASLGELTAGIAHEIQNPLNFVNNFSEVNREMIAELKEEIEKGNYEEVKIIASDIESNEEKINHHGKRAEGIVKGMLQHSRKSEGKKEPTDINALCDEYLRLSYHGLRAKDKSFNANFETDFDTSIEKINIVPQDMGRVILNLINNAFYAVSERKKLSADSYQPLVSIKTRKVNDKIEILVADNGGGIPDAIKEKIFQPFFTTKPTGQGTGLGLSLSYDIIKAHGGEIKVESRFGEETAPAGTTFIIQLPKS